MPTLLFGTYELDSLEQRLKLLPEGEEKVNILNKLGYLNYSIDVKNTFIYAQQALELSEKINYLRGKAYAYNVLSIANSIGGDKDLSYQHLEKSIYWAEKIKAYDLLIKAYNIKASNFDKEGRLDEALIVFQKGLDLANKTNDEWGIAVIPLNLGDLHSENGDYSLARTYFRQSIKEGEHQKNVEIMSWGCSGVAKTFLKEDSLAQAIFYFDKSLIFAKQIQNERSIAYTLFNLAEIYLKTNKYELAEKVALESIALFEKIGDKKGLWNATSTLMEIYLATKRPAEALKFVPKNLKSKHHLNDINNHAEVLKLIIAAHVQQNSYKKAYEVDLELEALTDSLNLEKKKNLVAELEEKYQLKKKETENTVLKLEQQKQTVVIKQQQRFNYSLIAVAILLSLLVFTTYNAYSNKRKNNLLLEEKVLERTQELERSNRQLIQSNQELERFAFVASHDLREPLMNIMSFTGLLQKKIDMMNDPVIKQFMFFIQQNTERMNQLILDTLEFTRLANVDLEIQSVDLNSVVSDIESAIAVTLKKKNALIQVAQTLPIFHTNTTIIFSLFKNLIENGIKYNESASPTILIDYSEDKVFYTFSIADNGIGIPVEHKDTIFEMFKRLQNRNKYTGSGLGLANCKKIVNKMGGDLWVESEEGQGATFYFTIKKDLVHSRKQASTEVPELSYNN